MITTYIKCHSRAAYIDRLIRSIKRHVAGHGPIVLLNDGVAEKYLNHLRTLHFGIQVRDSFKVTDPPADPNDLRQQRYDPAKFWVREIGRDPNGYAAILEEDTWITDSFDLPLVMRNLEANDAMMLRLSWNSMARLAPSSETVFTAVLSENLLIRYYSPTIGHLSEVHKIFMFAHGIFRKDYWCAAFGDAPEWLAEPAILKRALDHLHQLQAQGGRTRFCDFGREVARPSFSSTGRSDAGGHGVAHKIDPRPYNAALDEAWLAGELAPMADYPADIGDAARLAAFKKRLTQRQIDEWALWRADYLGMYRRMGCDVA